MAGTPGQALSSRQTSCPIPTGPTQFPSPLSDQAMVPPRTVPCASEAEGEQTVRSVGGRPARRRARLPPLLPEACAAEPLLDPTNPPLPPSPGPAPAPCTDPASAPSPQQLQQAQPNLRGHASRPCCPNTCRSGQEGEDGKKKNATLKEPSRAQWRKRQVSPLPESNERRPHPGHPLVVHWGHKQGHICHTTIQTV